MKTSRAAAATGTRSPLPGPLLALIAASSYATVINLARFSYGEGANAVAAIETRMLAAAGAMGLFLLVMRRSFRVPIGVRRPLAEVSLGVFLLTVGYLGSITFIPVSLAVVIFYTYPLIVAALVPLLERSRPSARQLSAFALAFVGLVLALGPSLRGLDGRGIALAFLAALSATLIFVRSPRVTAELPVQVIGFYVNLGAALLMLPVMLAVGPPVGPASPAGWLALLGVAVFYLTAVTTQFLALGAAGPVRTALVFNAEPVVALLIAALLLGERLGPTQLGGVALVLLALLLSTLARRRS